MGNHSAEGKSNTMDLISFSVGDLLFALVMGALQRKFFDAPTPGSIKVGNGEDVLQEVVLLFLLIR